VQGVKRKTEMGYHVTILRTTKGKPSPLIESEIHNAVSEFPQFSFQNNAVFRNGEFFLALNNGELWLKNPETNDISDMLLLANSMRARVRGDEFETYESQDKTYIHPDDKGLVSKANKELENIKKQSRKRSMLLNISIFTFFVLLVVLFKYMGWLN
jgi:hypothetical protein